MTTAGACRPAGRRRARERRTAADASFDNAQDVRQAAQRGDASAQQLAHHERPAALGYARLLRVPRHPDAGPGWSGGWWGAVRALLRERNHLHAEPCLHADRQAATGARRLPAARHAARRPGAAAGAPGRPRLRIRAGGQAACVGAHGGGGAAPPARGLRTLRVVPRPAIHLDSPFNGYAAWLREHHPRFMHRLEAGPQDYHPAEAHFSTWAAERAIAFLAERDPARPSFST